MPVEVSALVDFSPFFSLIRLITLSNIAQSEKNATTPTTQTTNNSVTILLNFRVQKYEIGGTY
jgi:hypothetical protein